MAAQKFFLENSSYPMFPQRGGLLTCGRSDDGDYILWLTRGPISEWPILVWDRGAGEGEEFTAFECDIADFIAGVVTGEILYPGYRDRSEYSWGQQPFKSTPDPWPEDPSVA